MTDITFGGVRTDWLAEFKFQDFWVGTWFFISFMVTFVFWINASYIHEKHPILQKIGIKYFRWYSMGWLFGTFLTYISLITASEQLLSLFCYENFVYKDDEIFICDLEWFKSWLYAV